jgi:Uma2 family endonuclease
MATTLISIPEYLATTYRPDREYIDGSIVERNVGEYDHANLQAALVAWFWKHRHDWNIRVLPEQRIQVSATRYRIPDVTVLSRAQLVEPVFTRPPLLLIEILSKDDTLRSLEERVTDYLDFGVAHIWIIDPGPQKAWAATRGKFEEPEAGVLRIPDSPLCLPLAELFAEADE